MKEHFFLSKESLIDLVSSGRIEEAIEICLNRSKALMSTLESSQQTEIFKGILILSRRTRDVAQNKILGIFSNQEIQIEMNNIISSFLDWLHCHSVKQ